MSTSDQFVSVTLDQNVLLLTIHTSSIRDYVTAKAIEQQFDRALRQHRTNRVVVDLHQVEYMTSVGYMPFLGLHHMLKDRGGRMALCNLSEVIKEVFEHSGLLIHPKSPFLYADSIESAIAMLSGGDNV